jgi:large repetitive protein
MPRGIFYNRQGCLRSQADSLFPHGRKDAMQTTARRSHWFLLLLLLALGGLTGYAHKRLTRQRGVEQVIQTESAKRIATPTTTHKSKAASTSLVPTQAGGGYNLRAKVIAGGGGKSSGGTYSKTGTIGQSTLGASSGGAFTIKGGFWAASQGACPMIMISPVTLNPDTAGVAYLQTFTQTGSSGTLTWSLTGTLPMGLSFTAATATLAGTPTQTGSFNFTVSVTDNNNCTGTVNYTLAINCPTITLNPPGPALPAGEMSAAYSQSFTQTGGVGTIAWSNPGGGLPGGLSLNPTTGVLSGTPTVQGTFTFTIRATDANNCTGERGYTLTIAQMPCPTMTVSPSNTNLTPGTVGTAYNQTFTQTGGNGVITWSVALGSLPGGLNLNAGTGVLSGTPTMAGTATFTVRATDANNCVGQRQYMLTINAAGTNLQFYPLPSPVRLLDTRPGASPNACSQPDSPINGGTPRLQPARSFCGIPANAAALTGNITTVQSGGGFLTLYPSGALRPTVASTNYGANEIINNVFTVGLGVADGAFNIYAHNTTDVVVDVSGYYAPPGAANSGGLYFHPLPAPVRLLETRAGLPVGCVKPGAPLMGGADSLQTATTACTGIPAAARSVVGNATTVEPAGAGYLTIYPADVGSAPLVASSNYNFNQIVNGPFTVGLSASGQFKIFTTQTTHLVVDLIGYFSSEAVDANGVGLLFTPLARPVRLLETRNNPAFPGCFKPNAPLNGGQIYTQPARGLCDGLTIPATAQAVVGNATVVFPVGGGYLTLWPSTAAQPTVATANYNSGDIGNRHFIVGLGNADGAFKLFSLAATDLVIDLSGYFAP